MGSATGGRPGEAVELRPIEPADAPGLKELIERCYGDAYPKRVMYQPDELARMIGSGALSGAVAEAEGSIVGHMGYTWPCPEATVVEAGTTVVDPRWRGRGLMKDLALELAGLLAADGASGFVHFPTTAHEVMQRAALSSGGRETGILVGYLPPDIREPGGTGSEAGRLAVTVVYQPVTEAPAQEIFLPRRYEDLIVGLADALWLKRSVAGPLETPEGESKLEHVFDEPRGLDRVTVARIGANIGAEVNSLVTTSKAGLACVDLPMNDPGVDFAVEELLGQGFAFAAWLPGWAGHDVLRLQRIENPSSDELAPELFSPEAEALMALIRAELLCESL
ncbi:MAG: GNAT family N-acetyltransferase [Solirubrobacterales bacterium]